MRGGWTISWSAGAPYSPGAPLTALSRRMAASSGGSFGSATYNGSSLPAGGVLRRRRCCCRCGVERSTSSSLVGLRGLSRDGGSFTLRSRPTGDDASLNGDGDLERLRRDPRLTTESSLAISAAHESQSILAARGGRGCLLTASRRQGCCLLLRPGPVSVWHGAGHLQAAPRGVLRRLPRLLMLFAARASSP